MRYPKDLWHSKMPEVLSQTSEKEEWVNVHAAIPEAPISLDII